MSYTVIWFIAFLLNGDPVAMTQVVKDGDVCSDAYATQLVKEVAQKNNIAFQELILWNCLPVVSPGPAAQINPPEEQLVPKRTL